MPETTSIIPRHIAIIMDGNRRWAKQHKLAALQGHEYVANKVIEPLVAHCIAKGISHLTLWAFSTENWQRDQTEVAGLMTIFRHAFSKNAQQLHSQGVKLNMIGDLSKFPTDIQTQVQQWLETSKDNKRITVTFALNYGGRDEIARAINKWMETKQTLLSSPADSRPNFNGDELSQFLDTTGMPDPDLIIRPGGEQRVSGFLPWQSVYSELYFVDTLMPDFTPAELDKALDEYARRQRRFGR